MDFLFSSQMISIPDFNLAL